MSTNVYCDLCEKEVGNDDSFVVDGEVRVMAFHFDCGHQVYASMSRSLVVKESAARGRAVESAVASGDFAVGSGTNQLLPPDVWKMREMSERLDATESLTRKVASVWRLWLNDAERGSINPGTFDAMKNLLGME